MSPHDPRQGIHEAELRRAARRATTKQELTAIRDQYRILMERRLLDEGSMKERDYE